MSRKVTIEYQEREIAKLRASLESSTTLREIAEQSATAAEARAAAAVAAPPAPAAPLAPPPPPLVDPLEEARKIPHPITRAAAVFEIQTAKLRGAR
jgi:hypothetical protein